MPPQNAAEADKADNESSKNGNLNNNNKDKSLIKLENLNKINNEIEPTATKTTIVIPPDGGKYFNQVIAKNLILSTFYY